MDDILLENNKMSYLIINLEVWRVQGNSNHCLPSGGQECGGNKVNEWDGKWEWWTRPIGSSQNYESGKGGERWKGLLKAEWPVNSA